MVLGTGGWAPVGPFESANSPSGLESPAALFFLLEHPHISAKLFSASP